MPSIRVEIAETTLTRLLSTGQLCAADLRCLDRESKEYLLRLCLKSCALRNQAARDTDSENWVECPFKSENPVKKKSGVVEYG